MKRILLMLLLLPTIAWAQDIEVRKETRVAKTTLTELKQVVKNGADTYFVFSFVDTRYTTIKDWKVIVMNKKEVKDLAVTLFRLGKDEYKAGEASASLSPDLLLLKSKFMGGQYIALEHKRATGNFSTLKQSNEFAKDIARFLTGKD